MKRLLIAILTLCLSLAFVACQEGNENDNTPKINNCEDAVQVVNSAQNLFSKNFDTCFYYINKSGWKESICPNLEGVAAVRSLQKRYCNEKEILSSNAAEVMLKREATDYAHKKLTCIAVLVPYSQREYKRYDECLNTTLNNDRPSWMFDFMRKEMAVLNDHLKHNFGLGLEEAGITKEDQDQLHQKYTDILAKYLKSELALYPTTPLKDSPNELVTMIIEADSHADKKELGGLSSEAYARMAERELQALRHWAHEYPNTIEHIKTLHQYLTDGKLTLKAIGTSESELAKLERRYPTVQ